MTIFTFGYGNRNHYRTLIKYFDEHEIKYLIDVRLKPYGWTAIWHSGQLEKFCRENDVIYQSIKELGNTSGKPNWVPQDELKAGKALNNLSQLCEENNLILMCSELDYRKCHRTEIAKRLGIMSNQQVKHLI